MRLLHANQTGRVAWCSVCDMVVFELGILKAKITAAAFKDLTNYFQQRQQECSTETADPHYKHHIALSGAALFLSLTTNELKQVSNLFCRAKHFLTALEIMTQP